MPMASRRALDAAGLKLSLASYQTLSVEDRRELVRLGGEPQVNVESVRVLAGRAGGAPSRELPPVVEPIELPDGLAAALAPRAIDTRLWSQLTALDRYVLDKLHRNAKTERLRAAFDEIAGRTR
jgi:hypothetical protein